MSLREWIQLASRSVLVAAALLAAGLARPASAEVKAVRFGDVVYVSVPSGPPRLERYDLASQRLRFALVWKFHRADVVRP